jgi:hypothetical protein
MVWNVKDKKKIKLKYLFRKCAFHWFMLYKYFKMYGAKNMK